MKYKVKELLELKKGCTYIAKINRNQVSQDDLLSMGRIFKAILEDKGIRVFGIILNNPDAIKFEEK